MLPEKLFHSLSIKKSPAREDMLLSFVFDQQQQDGNQEKGGHCQKRYRNETQPIDVFNLARYALYAGGNGCEKGHFLFGVMKKGYKSPRDGKGQNVYPNFHVVQKGSDSQNDA